MNGLPSNESTERNTWTEAGSGPNKASTFIHRIWVNPYAGNSSNRAKKGFFFMVCYQLNSSFPFSFSSLLFRMPSFMYGVDLYPVLKIPDFIHN